MPVTHWTFLIGALALAGAEVGREPGAIHRLQAQFVLGDVAEAGPAHRAVVAELARLVERGLVHELARLGAERLEERCRAILARYPTRGVLAPVARAHVFVIFSNSGID